MASHNTVGECCCSLWDWERGTSARPASLQRSDTQERDSGVRGHEERTSFLGGQKINQGASFCLFCWTRVGWWWRPLSEKTPKNLSRMKVRPKLTDESVSDQSHIHDHWKEMLLSHFVLFLILEPLQTQKLNVIMYEVCILRDDHPVWNDISWWNFFLIFGNVLQCHSICVLSSPHDIWVKMSDPILRTRTVNVNRSGDDDTCCVLRTLYLDFH